MVSFMRRIVAVPLTVSMILVWASALPAETIKGNVRQAADAERLFTLQSVDGKLLLLSWNEKTRFRNGTPRDAITPEQVVVVDFSRHKEQLVATTITVPSVTLPAGLQPVSVEEVASALDTGDRQPFVVDTRQPEAFAAGHLPGARSIPLPRIVKRTAGLLPADKEAVIVFYDDGSEPDCAITAAELTRKNGYANVRVLQAGTKGWKAAGRFLAVSTTFIRKQKPAIVDLRRSEQAQTGHLEGAVNYPLAELGQKRGNFSPNKRTPIVVYGENDKESLAGAAIIRQWGYTQVTYFPGGAERWLASAEPLDSGPFAVQGYVAGHDGHLQPSDFAMALISPQTVEVVDLRSDADFRRGHFQQGLHIPLQSLAARLAELSRDKIQVVFAADEIRAEMGYDFLKSKGYRVNYFAGGVQIDANGEYRVQ